MVARSSEAKALKIPMGAPLFKIIEIVRENNVKVLSSNYELYGDIHERLNMVLEMFSPDIER